MPPQEQDGHSPDVPFTRLASASFKVVSSIAAIVAAISTIYVSLFSPNRDLLQFLGFSAATLATVALGLAAFVVRLKARSSGVLGDNVASQPAFTQEERAAARNRLVPLGLALVACSIVLFTTDHFLMPKILEIGLSDTDSEVLIIKGSRFGKDVSRVWVRFSGATTEEQVARKADANVIEVVVPSKFSKGTISVRRGPRVSGPVSFTFPGVIYETAVVRLIQQSEDPIQRLMAQLEPYPGFPYYSDISDKPTQWPPRVFKDRSDFNAKVRQALSGAAAQEVAGWESRTPPKLTFLGGSPDDPQLKLNQSYARLRMLLTDNNGDYRRVSAIVGPHAAQALRTLEDARRALATNLPNRAFILRVRNQSPEDAENFTVELKVGGYVYDVTVNEEGEKAHSLQWSPDRINIDLPRLRPGYTTDIKVWYAYLPLSERVFADAADVEWEKTQGIVVHNLGVSNGLIRRSSRLLRDLNPYHRYAVDPVQGSPTFGSLPEPSSEAALPVQHPRTEPVPSSSVTNESDKQTQESVPPAQPPKSRQTGSGNASPQSSGAMAVLVHVITVKHYEQQNEAREAQIRVTKAFDDFMKALGDAARAGNGYWIYQRATPTKAEYSNYSGSYNVTGDVLGILRVDHSIQVESLPGWPELQRAGKVSVQSILWDKARYRVVLQFFSDPHDSKNDSKRVLTQELALDQIFDLQQAQAGNANEMTPGFADLLRFTRERLVARYHAPFTLNDVTEVEKPFYLVVREEEVNENFYLPDSWMAVAEKPGQRRLLDATLSSELWTLFDYGQNSRELTPNEFASIFSAK